MILVETNRNGTNVYRIAEDLGEITLVWGYFETREEAERVLAEEV